MSAMGDAGTADLATGFTPQLMAGVIAGALLAIALCGFMVWRWYRQRAARSVASRLRRACDDMVSGVLLADADLGPVHFEFVLFNRQGVTVVDIRDAQGHVFGSETMQDWTVLTSDRRFTFPNPLPALYDRVAAIRRLAPEIPVQGYVAFMAGADFSKGQPRYVVMLDEFIADVTRGSRAPADDMGTQRLLQPLWDRLKQEFRPGRPAPR